MIVQPYSAAAIQTSEALPDRLLEELEQLFGKLGLSVDHVTHDVGEAFALGRRVAVMRAGSVVQAETPDALWARPADAWVARFLGLANVEEHGATATVTRPEAVRLVSQASESCHGDLLR